MLSFFYSFFDFTCVLLSDSGGRQPVCCTIVVVIILVVCSSSAIYILSTPALRRYNRLVYIHPSYIGAQVVQYISKQWQNKHTIYYNRVTCI